MTVARHPLLAESPFDQAPVPGRPNPYWDEIRTLRLDRDVQHYAGTDHAIPVELDDPIQRRLVRTYAHAIPTPSDLDWIADVLDGRAVVEVAAGNGYWAWQLTLAGVKDVAAFDRDPYGDARADGPGPRYHRVDHGEHEVAARYSDRALMLCWPPPGEPLAADALRAYAGDLLIYVGEPKGGCTADRAFFHALASGWRSLGHSPRHVTYGGLHCRVEAYKRLARSKAGQ
ncbi:hypothetical protein SUDANB95_07915 (plasmid) [Actinosynnema sp. ALI-1.44]